MKLLNYIITPDFIPHTKFHRASWYREPNQCEWYWCGIPRTKYHLDVDESFYETLDQPLVRIVKHLHDRGIATTPSCTGHIQNAEFYETRWDSLKEQEQRVHTTGITLHNPETDHQIKYKNLDYKLPWSKNKFVQYGMKHGKFGCLGIIPGKHKYPSKIPGFAVKKDGPFVIYLTKSESIPEIYEKWNDFSNHIIKSI